jgi:polar amino acid transport system substrate-binding protein
VRRLGALSTAFLLLVAACSSKDNGGTIGGPVNRVSPGPAGALKSKLPASIAQAGVIRIGAAVGRAPLLFYATGTNTTEGIDSDLLMAMTRQLGVTLTIVNDPLVQLGPDLLAHRIDAFGSGFVDIKPFEQVGIDFVDYMTGRSAVVIKQGNPLKVHGPDDLCGRKVGFVGGTAQQLAVSRLDSSCKARGRATIRGVPDRAHSALLKQLTTGKLDALLDDSIVAAYTSQESTGADSVEMVGAAVEPVPYGLAVSHANPQLRDALHDALLAIIKDGEYDAALARWGGEDAALRTATINAGPSV